MKLISTEHGQLFLQLLAEDIRPPSGLYLPDLLMLIQNRYGFVVIPELQSAITEGAKFAQGKLVENNRLIEIKEFGVYSDGIIIVTLNTNDSEMVLEDFANWTTRDLGFRAAPAARPKRFQSSVVIEFDMPIDQVLGAFSELKNEFSDIIRKEYGFSETLNASRIVFSVDPAKLPRYYSFDFTLERRTNSLPSQNRYFSFANLSTDAHLALLQNLERRLAGGVS